MTASLLSIRLTVVGSLLMKSSMFSLLSALELSALELDLTVILSFVCEVNHMHDKTDVNKITDLLTFGEG